MVTAFSVIVEDFDNGLGSISEIVNNGTSKGASPAARVATIHAATLLLAATFEEFVREMAREYAICVVRRTKIVADLPESLLETAWRRTLDRLARNKLTVRSKGNGSRFSVKAAKSEFDSLCAFIEGDMGQDIFAHLIHNENHMRAREINGLFKISGLSNACREFFKFQALKEFFEQEDEGKAHGLFLLALDDFFGRRNEIAHSLNSAVSSGPEQIHRDIELFRALSRDMGATLDSYIQK